MKKTMLAAALAFAASSAAQADGLSYDYIDLDDQFGGKIEFTGLGDVDNHGWGIRTSVSVGENAHAGFDYSAFDSDPSLLKTKIYRIYGGYHMPLSAETDLVLEAGFEGFKLDLSGVLSESGNGYNVRAGLRAQPAESLQFGAYVGAADDGSTIGRWGLAGAEVIVTINDRFAVSANLDVRSGAGAADGVTYSSYGAGLRFSF